MKTKLLILMAVCLTLAGYSQTTNITDLAKAPLVRQSFITFEQGVEQSREINLAISPAYAPDIVVDGAKHQFGFGVALMCPASAVPALDGTLAGEHLFAGIRLDLLGGQFFASTIGVGVKSHFQIYGHDFTYIVEGGANIPLSGAGDSNLSVGGMLGTGLSTVIYQWGVPDANNVKPWTLNGAFVVEHWFQFNGQVYRPVVDVNYSF